MQKYISLIFVVSAQTRTWRDEAGQSPIIKDVSSGAPNENIVQNHLNIALLNVF